MPRRPEIGWDEEEKPQSTFAFNSTLAGSESKCLLRFETDIFSESEITDICSASHLLTCSGLRPGGTQAYSSEAHPESSSEMECLWKSDTSFIIIFSSCPGTERTACSSRTHLQCTQIFLQEKEGGFVRTWQHGNTDFCVEKYTEYKKLMLLQLYGCTAAGEKAS